MTLLNLRGAIYRIPLAWDAWTIEGIRFLRKDGALYASANGKPYVLMTLPPEMHEPLWTKTKKPH